jgi:site-specific recombinase XerC
VVKPFSGRGNRTGGAKVIHKNAHHGHKRVIPLNQAARKIVQRWIDCCDAEDEYLFRPIRCYTDERGTRYTHRTLAQAVRRAAKKAGVPPWSPNQIRHSVATEVRKALGLEAAQTLLGHARAATTEIYAEPDASAAQRAADLLGGVSG